MRAYVCLLYSANWYNKAVAELRRIVPIDAYYCLKNKELPWVFGDSSSRHKYRAPMFWEKLALISRYKYVIAFENADMDEWVTERLYHPFL